MQSCIEISKESLSLSLSPSLSLIRVTSLQGFPLTREMSSPFLLYTAAGSCEQRLTRNIPECHQGYVPLELLSTPREISSAFHSDVCCEAQSVAKSCKISPSEAEILAKAVLMF